MGGVWHGKIKLLLYNKKSLSKIAPTWKVLIVDNDRVSLAPCGFTQSE